MHEFRGKVAVITGAAPGIGLSMAKLLARQGMQVALLLRSACRSQGLRWEKSLRMGSTISENSQL